MTKKKQIMTSSDENFNLLHPAIFLKGSRKNNSVLFPFVPVF